jgi:hypothetical protein
MCLAAGAWRQLPLARQFGLDIDCCDSSDIRPANNHESKAPRPVVGVIALGLTVARLRGRAWHLLQRVALTRGAR